MSIRASSAKWPPSHRDRSISAGYSDSKFSLPSTSAFSQHPFFPNSASSRPLSCSILETGKTGNHVYVIQPSIDCGIFFRHFWQPLMSCRRSLHPTQRPSTRPPSQALILSPTAESPPIGSSFLTYCAHRHPVAPPPLSDKVSPAESQCSAIKTQKATFRKEKEEIEQNELTAFYRPPFGSEIVSTLSVSLFQSQQAQRSNKQKPHKRRLCPAHRSIASAITRPLFTPHLEKPCFGSPEHAVARPPRLEPHQHHISAA